MIHVFGHTHPDSDAICTAVVTASWLSKQNRPAKAWRLGVANRETEFIFDTAGINLPPLLNISLRDEEVWLVDFNEPAQGPIDLHQAQVKGVIDHHRLGGIITQLPPEVWIKPVGSSATLLWMLMGPELQKNTLPTHAILLLGALLSDTVNLKSPTTTEDDIRAATELSILSGLNRKSFAKELLLAKTDIEGLTADQLLNKDLKSFVIAGMDVRIAQLEVASAEQIASALDEVKQRMNYLLDQTGAALIVLMVTDIRECYSTLHFSGGGDNYAASCSVPGMLSRKKQLLPWLEHYLKDNRSQS